MAEILKYGLNIEKELQEHSEEDYVFGGFGPQLKCLAQIPVDVREDYLPQGEVQRGAEDTMDCASRSVINILETKFNWLLKNGLLKNEQWLGAKGYITKRGVEFSDAFVAINSGTTKQGNSLIAPLKSVHSEGLIPKSMLPLDKIMTWDEYHDPKRVTPKMIGLGDEFTKRFKINYERVYAQDYAQLLEEDLINVAGYAWIQSADGEYHSVPYQPNHAFMLYTLPAYYAFDNYEEGANDFIKKLSTGYSFLPYGYRVIISSEEINPVKKNWLKRLLEKLFK